MRLSALIGAVILLPSSAFAWETAGHALVADTAARLLRDEHPWLASHAFVLAYYANAPDIVWKQDPAIEPREAPEHYINLESFPPITATDGERGRYFAKHPDVALSAGRVPWRVAELDHRIGLLAKELRRADLRADRREALTRAWIETAGILAHYVGDLGMPLHTTHNYDGQRTGQRGLHHFFEGTLVDALMPELATDVWQRARARRDRHRQPEDPFDAALTLMRSSHALVPAVLAQDTKLGRNDVARAAQGHRDIIAERLATASLTLAALWRRHLGWSPASHEISAPPPRFITPGEPAVLPNTPP